MYNPVHAIGMDFHLIRRRNCPCQPADLPANIWLSLGLLLFLFILIRLANFRPFNPFPVLIIISSPPAFFLFGAWWFQFRQPTIDAFHIAFYNDRDYEMLVTGTLNEPPDQRDTYSNLTLNVEAVDSGSGDMPASGMLLVRTSALADYEYGQRVRVRGSLKTPPENEEFSYRDYLARQGIHSTMSTMEVTVLPGNGGNLFFRQVYKLKGKLLENTYRLYQDPEASLLAGILLGVDTGMTKELQNAFKNTGTAHIIAISGFNIAIIAGIFFAIFKNLFGERIGAVVAIVGIFFYTLLVGADAAVLRAALMGTLALVSRQLGRRNNGIELAWRGGHVHADYQSAVAVGCGLSTFLFRHPRAYPLRRAVLQLHPQPVLQTIQTGCQCLCAHLQRKRHPDLRRATYNHSDHGISFQTHLPHLVHRQPVHPVGATRSDGTRRAGSLHQPAHLSAGTTHRVVRLALRRVHHPHCGIVRPRAAWLDLSWGLVHLVGGWLLHRPAWRDLQLGRTSRSGFKP